MNVCSMLPGIASHRLNLACVLFLTTFFLAGCGGGSYSVAPLDPEEARETLQIAMESWKNGEPLDSLQNESPPIIMLDIDWNSGFKLVNFEIVDEGREWDGNLVSPVKLTLQDDRGSQTEQTVTYRITTSPGLVVMREIRH